MRAIVVGTVLLILIIPAWAQQKPPDPDMAMMHVQLGQFLTQIGNYELQILDLQKQLAAAKAPPKPEEKK